MYIHFLVTSITWLRDTSQVFLLCSYYFRFATSVLGRNLETPKKSPILILWPAVFSIRGFCLQQVCAGCQKEDFLLPSFLLHLFTGILV